MQFLDKLPWQGGESSEEVLVSLTFDFVFVYLRPHFGKGGYCAQRRRVPVPGSRLLIKPLRLLGVLEIVTSICIYNTKSYFE